MKFIAAALPSLTLVSGYNITEGRYSTTMFVKDEKNWEEYTVCGMSVDVFTQM
eukprot:Pgem_evm1s12460